MFHSEKFFKFNDNEAPDTVFNLLQWKKSMITYLLQNLRIQIFRFLHNWKSLIFCVYVLRILIMCVRTQTGFRKER